MRNCVFRGTGGRPPQRGCAKRRTGVIVPCSGSAVHVFHDDAGGTILLTGRIADVVSCAYRHTLVIVFLCTAHAAYDRAGPITEWRRWDLNPRTPERQDHPCLILSPACPKAIRLTLARLDYSSAYVTRAYVQDLMVCQRQEQRRHSVQHITSQQNHTRKCTGSLRMR